MANSQDPDQILWKFRRSVFVWPSAYFIWHIFLFKSFCKPFTTFPHTANLQQTTLKMSTKHIVNLYNCRYNYWKKVETLWQKVKLLVLSNFSSCHDVFKSRPLQMCQKRWERVNVSSVHGSTVIVVVIILWWNAI